MRVVSWIFQVNTLDFSKTIPSSGYELRAEETRVLDFSKVKQTVFYDVPKPISSHGMSMVHDHAEPIFFTMNLWDKIEDILSDPVMAESLHMKFERTVNDDGMRTIGELYTSNWMRRMQHELGPTANILAIILAMDETPMSMNGRNVHPVYVTLGNIPLRYR